MSDIVFPDGLIVKAPHQNAPDFVKCNISLKVNSLIDWLGDQEGDWVNLQVKESKDGKWYAAVDTWKPEEGYSKKKFSPKEKRAQPEDFVDDLPF